MKLPRRVHLSAVPQICHSRRQEILSAGYRDAIGRLLLMARADGGPEPPTEPRPVGVDPERIVSRFAPESEGRDEAICRYLRTLRL
jgi:hypothetical protein